MAAFTKQPALSMTGSILAAMSAAAGSTGSSAAIMLLPGHVDTEYSALAKSCCCCNKPEEKEVSLGCCCRRLGAAAPSILQLLCVDDSLVVLQLTTAIVVTQCLLCCTKSLQTRRLCYHGKSLRLRLDTTTCMVQVKLLRCGQCGCTNYCSSNCQKTDWKMGHKGICKELGAWRTSHITGSTDGTTAQS